jgi:2-phospho-L-lactate guanylyltransferase
MLEDVLRALTSAPRIGLVATVSPDEDVLSHARGLDAEAIAEPPGTRGINGALRHALAAVSDRKPDALLVVLADVPAITPADVDAILDALPAGPGIVVCPSAADGTSALALRPPDVVPFNFGPHSFAMHRRSAAVAGVPVQALRIESIFHDIDSPDDLRAFVAQPAGAATHRLLGEIAPRALGGAGA